MKKIILAVLFSVFLLSAFAGVQFVGQVSAIDYTEYTGTLDGADWALRIPDPWNGMLVVICQGGFTPLNPVIILTMFSSSMLNQGFAVAASNYGAEGWPVAEGVESTYQLTNYIIENYSVTGRVFLYGFSLGGGVALLLGEEYPDIYSGVLDAWGIKDMKHLYTHAATWANMTDEELTAELTALGTPVPPPGYETLQEFRDGLVLLVSLYETVCGGTPLANPTGYEALSPTYHANIQIPVITVHGTADPFVPHRQSIMYKNAVAQAGKAYLYRLYNVTGGLHVDSPVLAEMPARFDELVAWSDALFPELTVGVNVDDWFIYEGTLVLWEADPGVPFPPHEYALILKEYNETDWYNYTVTDIVGETVTFEILTHWSNGSETTSVLVDNMTSSFTMMIIGANLEPGTQIRDEVNWTEVFGFPYVWPPRYLNETIMVEYINGTFRETNVLDFVHPPAFPGAYTRQLYHWDKEYGIQARYEVHSNATTMEGGEYAYIAAFQLIDSSIDVLIIPEYPLSTVMLPLFVAITVSMALYKRKRLRH